VKRWLAGVLVLLVAGCSLPLPSGVKTAAGLPAEQQRSGEVLQVLPPGPKPGQTPKEIVQGFLQAQANAEDSHAIARSFLTPALAQSWDDSAGVQVYLSASQTATLLPEGGATEARVQVSAHVTGTIAADGAYAARESTSTETYSLARSLGEWRLTVVPAGLRLSPADQDRALRPSVIYYVGLPDATGGPRLVPDRVYLPSTGSPAARLVRRLLRPPSSALVGSVADEPGLRATAVSVDGAGVVSVDLPGADRLAPSAREDLSARLVWTLRGLGSAFRGLQIRSNGRPLKVNGQGAVQDAGAWDAYDPEGLGVNPPYFYVAGRRLRASPQLQLPSTAATAGEPGFGQAIGVDAVAVTPDRTQVALLDGTGPGIVTVRTGPLRGPYRDAVRAVGLTSPSYGAGGRGLWLVRRRAHVSLLPPGEARLRDVPVMGQPIGALTRLAVSRDGARIALVIGGKLFIGRIEYVGRTDGAADRLRITALLAVAPAVRVSDVAWQSGTELVVVGRSGSPAALLRVAIDGSGLELLGTGGQVPEHVTASSAGIVFSEGATLYSYTGRRPQALGAGRLPVYPG
jgi:hypothetical protein